MPRLTITSGSAGAIFISFRGWLQQLALVREREKKEERNLACVWAPLGLHARRGHPGAKCKGWVCQGAPPGQREPSARPWANETQIKSTRFAEAVVRACWQQRREVVSAPKIIYEIWSRGRGSPGRRSLATERGAGGGWASSGQPEAAA